MPPHRRNTFGLLDAIVLGAVALAAAWIAYRVDVKIHYRWNWGIMPQYLLRFDAQSGAWVPGLILQGLIMTLRLSFGATLLGLLLGTAMGLCRSARSRFRRLLGWGYVELIRNIPIIVWIFIFYYFIGDQLLPLLGLERLVDAGGGALHGLWRVIAGAPEDLPVFTSGLLALAIYEGAYITEIVRAGVQSIERGQWEASAALGFDRWQQLRHVVLPQALRRILPPLAGQFISTIKDSSIVSVISIQELTFQGMELMSAALITFEVWITVLALYLVVCLACSLATAHLETRLRKGAS